MLKKLRRKFIAIAMLSVSIVLIAIVGTINIANYISTNQALDARLSLIADNGGTFPDMTPGDSGKKLEPKTDQPPAMNDLQKHGISQESPFDTRYFTVTIASDGTVGSVDTGKIASISAGTAEEYAVELWKKGKKKGFFALTWITLFICFLNMIMFSSLMKESGMLHILKKETYGKHYERNLSVMHLK